MPAEQARIRRSLARVFRDLDTRVPEVCLDCGGAHRSCTPDRGTPYIADNLREKYYAINDLISDKMAKKLFDELIMYILELRPHGSVELIYIISQSDRLFRDAYAIPCLNALCQIAPWEYDRHFNILRSRIFYAINHFKLKSEVIDIWAREIIEAIGIGQFACVAQFHLISDWTSSCADLPITRPARGTLHRQHEPTDQWLLDAFRRLVETQQFGSQWRARWRPDGQWITLGTTETTPWIRRPSRDLFQPSSSLSSALQSIWKSNQQIPCLNHQVVYGVDREQSVMPLERYLREAAELRLLIEPQIQDPCVHGVWRRNSIRRRHKCDSVVH